MGFVIMGVIFGIGIFGYNKMVSGYGNESRVIMHHVNYNHFGR